MAKWEINNSAVDEYLAKLEQLGQKSTEMIGRAIYPAAGMVTDKIKSNIQALPVTTKRGSPEHPIDGVTSAQKTGLLQGLGIAKMTNNNGYVNVKVGFSGYNATVSTTAKTAGGTNTRQANVMIARAVEGGTSFRKKHPFVAPAVRAVRKNAEEKIKVEIEAEIEKLGF